MTDDVARTYDKLSQGGVELPPRTAECGFFAVFKDPDGTRSLLGSK